MTAGFKMDDYVDVAQRIHDFYERFPDGRLTCGSAPTVQDIAGKPFVWYHARAYRTPDDPLPGDGWAAEPVPGPTQFTRDSELMNAETAAWGRAIVALGFSTKKIASAQEVKARTDKPAAATAKEAAGTPGAGAAGTDGSAKAAPAPPTTTELRAQYETLARSWARMEATFDASASVRKADEKLASAKAAGDAEPYRKFLTAQVESFMALINRRNADLEAAAAFPIPETNLEAAGKA